MKRLFFFKVKLSEPYSVQGSGQLSRRRQKTTTTNEFLFDSPLLMSYFGDLRRSQRVRESVRVEIYFYFFLSRVSDYHSEEGKRERERTEKCHQFLGPAGPLGHFGAQLALITTLLIIPQSWPCSSHL